MTHTLDTVTELLDRQVKDGVIFYFDFVEKNLLDAIKEVQQNKKIFENTQDFHAILKLATELSKLNLAHERAVILTNKIATTKEEIIVLEDIANEGV